MVDAYPGVEQLVIIADDARGWNLTPDVGGITVGATGNYEEYFAGTVTAALQAGLAANFSFALDTYRYGDSAKGLNGIATDPDIKPWMVMVLGNGNGGGSITGTAGAIVKAGQIAVQGLEIASPADGIVSATGELPTVGSVYEAVQGYTEGNIQHFDLTAVDTLTWGTFEDGDEDRDIILLMVTEATGSGLAQIGIGSPRGPSMTIPALATDEFRIYDLTGYPVSKAEGDAFQLVVTPGTRMAGYATRLRMID